MGFQRGLCYLANGGGAQSLDEGVALLDPIGAAIEYGASELQDYAREQYENAPNPLTRAIWGAVEIGAIGAPAIYEAADMLTPDPSDVGDAAHAVDNVVEAVQDLARQADDVAQGVDDVPTPSPSSTPTPTATPEEPPVNGGGGMHEAACKTLVVERMKQSGISWRDAGGQDG